MNSTMEGSLALSAKYKPKAENIKRLIKANLVSRFIETAIRTFQLKQENSQFYKAKHCMRPYFIFE